MAYLRSQFSDSIRHVFRGSAWPSVRGNPVIHWLVLANLGITLSLALILNIWEDDASSLNTSGKDVFFAIQSALRFEVQPPLYFVLLNLWRSLSSSVFFASLFSVLCTTLSLCVVAKLSVRFNEGVHPGWIMAIVALHPFVIYAAVEIRVYALAILLSALLLLFFYDGYLSKWPRSKAQWYYVLIAILALYTQYFLGFLLVADAVALLVLRRWHEFRRYCFQMIIVAICFLPMLSAVQAQTNHVGEFTQKPSLRKCIIFAPKRILEFVVPQHWMPRSGRSFFYFGCTALFALLLWRYRLAHRFTGIALWTITGTLALSFASLLSFTGTQLMEQRHTAALFLPSVLSSFSLVQSISSRKALISFVIICLFFNAASLCHIYAPMAKAGDYSRVASLIRRSEAPNQPILVFTAEVALPLAYYYTGPNQLIPLPREETCQTFDLHRRVLKSEQEISTALSRVPGDHPSIWLVNIPGSCSYLNVDYNCPVLEAFVANHYSTQVDKIFYGSRVRLLRRVPSPKSPDNIPRLPDF
jgi:hypothetical protein